MRNPIDVVFGRVDQKINRKVYGAKLKARQAAEGKVRGAMSGAKKKATKKGPKKKKMGFFNKNKGEAEAALCPSCGKDADASWATCPYCGGALSDAPAAPAGQPPVPGGAPGPAPMAGAPANRTMAIDISALQGPSKSVVGWLVAMSGNQKGMDFRLFEGTNNLGAAADNDIVITDEYLSSRHAVIRFEDNRYDLIDNGSTNGSFVNEKRISKEELIDNDTVRLGRTEFRFKALY